MGQPYAYAKNLATFAPMGPVIVTKKELPDPAQPQDGCAHQRQGYAQRHHTKMIFDPYQVLAYCSDYTPMQAGDIISLGTFAGDKEIHAGDTVELEIEKIGILRNKVVAAKAPWPNFTEDKPTGPLVKENNR